jgi:hypothetical protein
MNNGFPTDTKLDDCCVAWWYLGDHNTVNSTLQTIWHFLNSISNVGVYNALLFSAAQLIRFHNKGGTDVSKKAEELESMLMFVFHLCCITDRGLIEPQRASQLVVMFF